MRLARCALLAFVAGCPAPPPADLASVRRGDLVQTVEVTGSLRAVDAVSIGPPPLDNVWNFNVQWVAAEGSEVAAGGRLLEFDPAEPTRSLASSEVEAATKGAELDKKRLELQMAAAGDTLSIAEAEAAVRKARLQATVADDLAGAVELQTARLDLELAEADLLARQARVVAVAARGAAELAVLAEAQAEALVIVAQLTDSIARMKITAPRAGTVVYLPQRNGEKPKVGLQVWRGQKILEVVALGAMFGEGEVDEIDSSRIALDQPITVRLDAHADAEVGGRLTSILAAVDERSRDDPRKVVRVELAVEPPDGVPLRPGMRFRGAVEVGRVSGALLVPLESVFVTPEGPAVWRQDVRRLQRVPVQVGARNLADVVITSGLAEGDRVARYDPRVEGGGP